MSEDTIENQGGNDTIASTSATGTFDAEQWRSLLPDEMKEDKSLLPFKTVGDLGKSYKELASKLGKEHVVKPNENSSKEAWDKYYTDLGRPESKDKYELRLPTEDGKKLSDEDVDALKQAAYDLALDPERAQKLVDNHIARRDSAAQKAADAQKAASENQKHAFETALREKFGTANLENLISAANTAVDKFGGEELSKFLDENNLRSNPAIVSAFIKIAQETGERHLGDDPKKEAMLTKEDAVRQRNQMLADKAGPYYNSKHPGHKDAVEEYVRLSTIVVS